jgi:predicted 3-demethylubiquinone-9 3-methyltransferase (glyoxalase superfamily)
MVTKISPQLIFNDQAEKAVQFYLSVFANSSILRTTYFTDEMVAALQRLPEEQRPGRAGDVHSITFQIDGQELMAVNGGSYFSFAPGICMYARCETQEEIDMVWTKLGEGGETQDCGWVRDKFGVSWQVVPAELWDMMKNPDQQKTGQVMVSIFAMEKLDVDTIRAAYHK